MMIEFVDGFLSEHLYTFCKCCIKPYNELAAYEQAVIKGRGHRRLAACLTRAFRSLNLKPSFPKSPSSAVTTDGKLPVSSELRCYY